MRLNSFAICLFIVYLHIIICFQFKSCHRIVSHSSLFATESSQKKSPSNSQAKQTWRIYNIEVLHELDPGKNSVLPHEQLLDSLKSVISPRDKNKVSLKIYDLTVVKKAFDGRWKKHGQPKWVYTVDITIPSSSVNKMGLKPLPGKFEQLPYTAPSSTIITNTSSVPKTLHIKSQPRIVIVGAGPAGLFAAITLVEAGYKPVIIERGYPVETRGLHIG